MMNYGYTHNGWGVGGWLLMFLMMIVFWGAVVWIVVTFVRQRDHHHHDGSAGVSPATAPFPDPFKILDERLAKGDIDVEEYEKRRTALRSSP